MQPSPAMQALIEQIYHTFHRYPVPKQCVVCCEYCLSQQEQKALQNTSLRALPYSLINAWNSSPGPDPQNSDEVRYFLPRLLEFVAQGHFDNIHEVFSLRRINLANKANWRADELAILQQFACQYMADWVYGDEAVELQNMLEMFFRADIALAPLLDAVISVPGYQPTVSVACFLWHNREENIQNSSFEQDDDDKAITAQINTWADNNQSILKERSRQAIENPLRQPEQGTRYQVWEENCY
ncbi:hypothetical protein WRSd3_03327 [Shigella dysenteriae WRSd3]|uniref:Uncharacterized protein n=4 Tax=Shigella dysenteriae TaxID=622 RepID=Q32AP0_SHIDS|nr:hypothetical protein SDY_3647 [Shigella dysenteriae Sd197]AHA67650.1 Hypothetical protein Asd1617_04823 [Shigella dysenteriae 1617]ESU77861.1 hypothetical protein WRSd3_03327 [Shigella dysenteriae WRSd3]ESU83188.1 hypothetical protein WRSd5_02033 [Shigella dysenteriae WRSd5]SPZ82321.1 Uncharacterised protein [Shigella dysenteriae]